MSADKPMHVAMLAALGVVYGDIGTSPLYTLKECFAASHITVNQVNVFGFVSLIFWSIVLVVTLKYVLFVLRADNKGEGGVMVLMQQALKFMHGKPGWLVMMLGLTGGALFYGDAIITPAISVLSAMEGLTVVSPHFEHFVIPLAMTVLVMLFVIQKRGTQTVGMLFGPVMLLWFLLLAAIGLYRMVQYPAILGALSPHYALSFVLHHGWGGFIGLGAVVLALTGAEALYADMGHFGRQSIQTAWFSVVLPALALNYFGQGALLMQQPAAISNPFFLSAPSWALLPLIPIAAAATIIASQAVISGTYSLTRQAIQLGFAPRMKVVHTNAAEIGQIYLPAVNGLLMMAVLLVIVLFRDSAHLAAAYGIAVTGTMILTSLMFAVVMLKNWHWSPWLVLPLTAVFLCFDLVFFSANLLKIAHGGWLPVLVAAVVVLIFTTWRQGKRLELARLRSESVLMQDLADNLAAFPPQTVAGNAIFLVHDATFAPKALLHNLKHNKILHQHNVLLTIATQSVPRVDEEQRLSVRHLNARFTVMTAAYGFQESPDMLQILHLANRQGLGFELMETSFFLSHNTLTWARNGKMNRLRAALFLWLNKNSARATDYFNIPSNRVVEMGSQVSL
ncbi:MAG: potassium transporter Kup [Neisseria sp.]|nr:potassium transporter Kup [Neisseria sp.]